MSSIRYKANNIWAIVPFSRPQWFENVLSNFNRQSFSNKRLVIVENGQAIGFCKSIGFKPDILLSCDIAHPANAKTTALIKLKELNEDLFSTFDDDDYYGEDYFNELYDNSDRADVIGKSDMFMKTTDDKLVLLESNRSNCFTDFLNGPTISGWIKESLLFQNVGAWAEDIAYIDSMKKAGAKLWSTSIHNFLYQRHNKHNHTWKASDEQIIQTWLNFTTNSKANEIMSDNFYKDITNNNLIKKTIYKKEYTKELSPAYEYANKNAGSFDEWAEKMIKEYS